MRTSRQIATAALLGALVCAQVFASPGTISKSATLRAHPSAAAKAVAKLPKGTDVEIKTRRGFWLQVLASESGTTREGWVKFIRVRQATRSSAAKGGQSEKSADKASSGGFFSSLSRGATGLFGGRRNTRPQSTTTIGIRGLSANDLRTSSENRSELAKLASIAPNDKQIVRFARSGKLQMQELAYIDPASMPGSANVAGNGSAQKSGHTEGETKNSDSGGISGLWRGITGSGDTSKSTQESGSGSALKSLFGGFTSGGSSPEDPASGEDAQGGSD